MAKEFKDYDKMYSHLQGTAMQYIRTYAVTKGVPFDEDVSKVVSWEAFKNGMPYVVFTQDLVKHAVYEVSTAEEWQIFRVRLKRLSTWQKLLCLDWRWRVACLADSSSERMNEHIRIANYLGALARGGQLKQLNKQLIVFK